MIGSLIDMDGDETVSVLDRELFRRRFRDAEGATEFEANFDPAVDMSGDGAVGAEDEAIFAERFVSVGSAR